MQSVMSTLTGLAEQINHEHKAAYGAAREALDHARKAGELLTKAKAQTEYGEWLPWLEANCDFSARTAQGYMRLAEHWPELESKYATVAHLGLRDALALLSEPKRLEPHEHCSLFPAMTDDEYEGLKSSLRREGFLEDMPITLLDGQILDGKERYRACLELGIEPKFETFEDVTASGYRGSPLDFVMSANLHRQHLSREQSGTIGGDLTGDERQKRLAHCEGVIHKGLDTAQQIMDGLAAEGRGVSWEASDPVAAEALATNTYLRDVVCGLREGYGKELSSGEIMRLVRATKDHDGDLQMTQFMGLSELGGILLE